MRKSESIRIIYKKRQDLSADNFLEDVPVSRTSEQLYESATWRMYHRIMNARRKKAVVAPMIQRTRAEEPNLSSHSSKTRTLFRDACNEEYCSIETQGNLHYATKNFLRDNMFTPSRSNIHLESSRESMDDDHNGEVFVIDI